MTTMNDDDLVSPMSLTSLLEKLPRHEASPEFTDRLMARLDEPARSPSAIRRPRWAVAAAAVMFLGVWLGGLAWRERTERLESEARVEMMRDEYRALALELEELRSLASEAQPVLELGGTEQVDFVFDLRELAPERDRMRATPTSHAPR